MFWSESIPDAVETSLRAQYGIPEDVVIEFCWAVDDCSPEDQFCDDADVEWVRKELDNGNDAAWFLARVLVTDGTAKGDDYLGGCSYRSFADFLTVGDYFEDMVSAAFQEYQSQVEDIRAKYCGMAF